MKNIKKPLDLDQQYLNKVENVTFNPIFIMGVQRSGTSILYKLLSQTNNFNIVTAYHIIKYNELLHNNIKKLEGKIKLELEEFFKNKSQTDRGIDKLQITPDFPEEYGFVLAQKTGQSKLTHETLKIFTEFCKKIQFISKNDKLLLLKNPFDFSNFVYIKSVFPETKFIFIHRNPIKTLNSQLKAMRTLLEYKSEYMALLSPEYDRVFDNKILFNYYRFMYSSITPIRSNKAIKNLVKSTDFFLENIESLTREDYICTRYEDICENPDSEIEKILKFLNIEAKSHVRYSDFIKPRKTTNLKEIQKKEKFILKRMKPYLSYFKYLENKP